MNNQTDETNITSAVTEEKLGEATTEIAETELSKEVLDITPLDEKVIEESIAKEEEKA